MADSVPVTKKQTLVELTLPVAVGVIATLVVLARVAASGKFGQVIWAEDGTVFVNCAVGANGPWCLTESIQGYLVVLLRLLTAPVAWLPPGLAAYWLETISCVVAGLCAGFIAFRARRVLGGNSSVLAVAAGLLLVCLPVMAFEPLGNIANLHLVLAPAAMWALIPQRTPVDGKVALAIAAVVCLLVPLTAPGAAPLALIAIWSIARIWRSGNPRVSKIWQALPPVVFLGATAIALGFYVVNRGQRQISNVDIPIGQWPQLVVDVFGAELGFLSGSLQVVVGITLLVLLVVLLAYQLIVGDGWHRGLAVVLTLVALITAAMTVLNYGASPRYIYLLGQYLVPVVLFGIAMIPAGRSTLRISVASVASALLLVSLLIHFPWDSAYLRGGWQAAARTAAAQCRESGAPTVFVPIAPKPWVAELPCSYLTR